MDNYTQVVPCAYNSNGGYWIGLVYPKFDLCLISISVQIQILGENQALCLIPDKDRGRSGNGCTALHLSDISLNDLSFTYT